MWLRIRRRQPRGEVCEGRGRPVRSGACAVRVLPRWWSSSPRRRSLNPSRRSRRGTRARIGRRPRRRRRRRAAPATHGSSYVPAPDLQPTTSHKEGDYGGVTPGETPPVDHPKPKHKPPAGTLSWIGFEAKGGGAELFFQSIAAFEVTQAVENGALVVAPRHALKTLGPRTPGARSTRGSSTTRCHASRRATSARRARARAHRRTAPASRSATRSRMPKTRTTARSSRSRSPTATTTRTCRSRGARCGGAADDRRAEK